MFPNIDNIMPAMDRLAQMHDNSLQGETSIIIVGFRLLNLVLFRLQYIQKDGYIAVTVEQPFDGLSDVSVL